MNPDPHPGIPGWFIAFFIIAIVVSVGAWLWRISVARNMAEEAGLDPNRAAKAAMFGSDGIDATYLASTLATSRPHAPPPPEPTKTTEVRLQELLALKDKGLISNDEYESQRRKILDAI